jgi:hypothetical protein
VRATGTARAAKPLARREADAASPPCASRRAVACKTREPDATRVRLLDPAARAPTTNGSYRSETESAASRVREHRAGAQDAGSGREGARRLELDGTRAHKNPRRKTRIAQCARRESGSLNGGSYELPNWKRHVEPRYPHGLGEPRVEVHVGQSELFRHSAWRCLLSAAASVIGTTV